MMRTSAVLLCMLVWCVPAAALDLTVELDPANQAWMRREQPIRLRLNGLPEREEGRLAVMVGDTDVTDLLVTYEGVLEYHPAPLPLDPGEYDVVVFLVSPQGNWSEVARLPIRVLTHLGLERRSFAPSFDLQGSQLLEERNEPVEAAGSAPPDAASLNLNLGGDAQGHGWRFSGNLHTVGVSQQANALRFAQEGASAPRFDLADYAMRLERAGDQRGYFTLGHVAYNQHRHLIPAFASRGTLLAAPLGKAGTATFAAMNGTSIAGWNNITGLARSEHRVTATNIGFELRPARPGALRVDVDYLDGSLLPQSNFNGGSIGDRQTNRAWGARVAGSTPSGRLRFETGVARSAFDNPADPSLSQGADLVPVEREERNARYADLNWDILQGKPFGVRVANLSLSLRHERIDPQYATIAAGLQADVLSNSAQLGGTLGPLQLQLAHAWLEDNLDDIPTILETRTRRTDALLAVPLSELFTPDTPALWLPAASYNFGRVHQFGTGVPPNSGFNESHVPNQTSDRHSLALDWRGMRWSLRYRIDYALQDNRQPGREQADFETRVHAANLSFTPHQRLDVNFELSSERNHAEEQDTVTRTRNVGIGLRFNVTDKLNISGTGGLTRSSDEPRTSRSESGFYDVSLTYRLEWKNTAGRSLSGQMFLRYSDRAQSAINQVFDFDVESRSHALVAGLTFGLR